MNKNIKKKILFTMSLVMASTAILTNVNVKEASSHGYINKSRAALGKEGINYGVGNAAYEPQSIEAIGGFPQTGPKDGEIAGGGIFPELDEQSEWRWVKVPMNGGKNTFTWTNTAPHATKEWKYYITKKGWDVNDKLERKDFEFLTSFDGGGVRPEKTVTHTLDIPTDREGYYVILGVWEIADTGMAFYQVMDINLKNNIIADTIAPTVPKFLRGSDITTNTAKLQWDKSTDNVGVSYYNIYRNGLKVAQATNNEYVDEKLLQNTSYSYTVTAVDSAGNESLKSNEITIKTQTNPVVDNIAPTAPSKLHSMGETSTTIDLMWGASTDNVGVEYYEIYRDGIFVSKTSNTSYLDSNLTSNKEYKYIVKAVDKSGNISLASNELKVKTKEATTSTGTWDKDKIYLKGDVVTVNGIKYTAKWWNQGSDPQTSAAWEREINNAIIEEWLPNRAYTTGQKVVYKGIIYEAKWWTSGEVPAQSQSWKIVQ